MAETLNTDLLFRMIAHWLNTKPNSYYGTTYGNPLEDMLQKPLSSPIADAFLAKMREDIPVLAALPSGTINLYVTSEGVDIKNIYIEVAGQTLSISDLAEVSRGNY
ncbi:hypothetical protein [Pseudomonas sp. NPDC090208]|uniref:hypothetical protein n=1 Tax=Pseudomonas sp. NPDC090208 TaxID=3364478 RepID=UPI00380FCCBD